MTAAQERQRLRIRDNQRRSRARKKDYVQFVQHQLDRVEAICDLRRAARSLAEEHREFLRLMEEAGLSIPPPSAELLICESTGPDEDQLRSMRETMESLTGTHSSEDRGEAVDGAWVPNADSTWPSLQPILEEPATLPPIALAIEALPNTPQISTVSFEQATLPLRPNVHLQPPVQSQVPPIYSGNPMAMVEAYQHHSVQHQGYIETQIPIHTNRTIDVVTIHDYF
ncbi:hypothetical protein BKA56DRAFT_106751 [Ilyonectria sp. MPI-CAGE-AT-0026]|nr:hypothetical protein BKA56DRAFT_106751 [Ilyonectria sp. MPI-CAGE-AT-0026]